MRRTGMWLSVLAIAVFAGGASASITVDGDWSDWFTYGGSGTNNWDQAAAAGSTLNAGIRSLADEEGPTPGYGGQLYDIEQIFYFFDDADANNPLSGGTLYVGLVTGFPPAGVDADGYYAGDLFLGLGGTGSLDIAVGVAEANVLDPTQDGRFGRAFFGSPGNWLDPDPFSSSTPWRMDLDDLPGGPSGGANEGTLAEVTGPLSPAVVWGGVGVHNFLEVSIALDGAGEEAITNVTTGGLGLHWTMGCGNDEITVNDTIPFAPVPEPTTMVLLGMGVLGMALRARRPAC